MILAHGCSHTNGTWHARHHGYKTWPEVLGEYAGEPVKNIAIGGYNSEACAIELIEYCEMVEKPSMIVVGWPDASRENIFEERPDNRGKDNTIFRTQFHSYTDKMKEDPRYWEYLMAKKFFAMKAVENYCDAHKIDYYYFHWDYFPYMPYTKYAAEKRKGAYKYARYVSDYLDMGRDLKDTGGMWQYCILNGCVGHCEKKTHGPDGIEVWDGHMGKDMHDFVGKLMYDFIYDMKRPDPIRTDIEKLEKNLKSNPNIIELFDYPNYVIAWQMCRGNFPRQLGINSMEDRERNFVYD